MRFLFSLLTVIWLLFGWVSFDALRYRPPMPPPWHAAQELEKVTPFQIDNEIDILNFVVQSTNLDDQQAANIHYKLAVAYWLKTYMQHTRSGQMVMLKRSLLECLKALKYAPDRPHFVYSIADIYHQMHDYENAEKYYQQALKMREDAHVARRYLEMKQEKDQIARS